MTTGSSLMGDRTLGAIILGCIPEDHYADPHEIDKAIVKNYGIKPSSPQLNAMLHKLRKAGEIDYKESTGGYAYRKPKKKETAQTKGNGTQQEKLTLSMPPPATFADAGKMEIARGVEMIMAGLAIVEKATEPMRNGELQDVMKRLDAATIELTNARLKIAGMEAELAELRTWRENFRKLVGGA